MSKLRQSILETIREFGNHSGCHQLADRSFFYNGKQFPICARCTGVVSGQLISLLLWPVCNIPVIFSCFLLFIMGIDWGIQELEIKQSTNIRRLITGICGGFGLFSLYGTILKHFIKNR